MQHRFQVSLNGLIELLSNHLYSSSAVFVRELMQNGVDAIEARRTLEPDHRGEIRVELHGSGPGPTLAFADSGIGLTEDQAHEFLATIGRSAKRGELPERDGGYLGQFGVGLLSCFVVAEEVVVVSRALDRSQPPIEWTGRVDGSYFVRRLEAEIEPGTTVYLRLRPDAATTFDAGRLRELIQEYGDFLPIPVLWVDGGHEEPLNAGQAPWHVAGSAARADAVESFARVTLGIDPLDSFEISSETGGVRGIAYVGSQRINLVTEPGHRVYLKGMLLSDSIGSLLPRWAFFLRCVVQTDHLSPTASREDLHQDELLAATRQELGESIKRTIIRMAEVEPRRLKRWIKTHESGMKLVACADDELYRLLAPHFSFPTNQGMLPLLTILDSSKEIAFAPTTVAFRQVAGVATGVNRLVVSGGYQHDRELLERVDLYDHEVTLKEVSLWDFAQDFQEPTDQDLVARLEEGCRRALSAFDCRVLVRDFAPATVPALYGADPEAQRERDLERAAEDADELFSSILGALSRPESARSPVFCVNASNDLVRGVARSRGDAAETALQVLYVHALLQAHEPLGVRERQILEGGLLELIARGLNGGEA